MRARLGARLAEAMNNSRDSDRGADDGAPPDVDEARLRQQAIGVKLRQMFDAVVNEPVPDDFLDILRRADEKSAANSGHRGNE